MVGGCVFRFGPFIDQYLNHLYQVLKLLKHKNGMYLPLLFTIDRYSIYKCSHG